jgi:hypothetical protein
MLAIRSHRYWEIMAHARWAVIALQQGERFVGGGEASLDLALTGRRIAELEYEMLAMIDPAAAPGKLPDGLPVDRPTAGELASLAAQIAAREIAPTLDGERKLAGLMLANAMGIVARDVKVDAEPVADRSLVSTIRAGKHDGDAGLHGALREDARARTKIANPKYPF